MRDKRTSKEILFIGFTINENECNQHMGPAVSANRMQLGLLEELKKAYGDSLSIITILPIATFPTEKNIYIKYSRIKILSHTYAIRVPFVNILFLKQLSQFHSVFFYTLVLILKRRIDTIITYNAHFETAKPALLAAKITKCKVVGLIADVITTVPSHYTFFKRILRKWEIKSYRKTIPEFDGLIVLNKKVIDTFAPSLPYVLMDGGIRTSEIDSVILNKAPKVENRILYTGALEHYNGIEELIEAFGEVENKNLKLVICGTGKLKEYVKKKSFEHENISYLGIIDNKSARKLQEMSGLLINTRPVNLYATQLTFPSKLIEYMLSGTPVLTTLLNGITEDYHPYLYFCGQTPSEITKEINYVMSLPADTRNEKGKRAREFILNNKTYGNHAKRIIPFIEKL